MAFEKQGIKPGREGNFAKDSTEKAKNMLKEATKEKTKGEKIRENLKEEIKKLDKIDKPKRKRNSTSMNKLNHVAFIMDGNGRWGKKKRIIEILDI